MIARNISTIGLMGLGAIGLTLLIQNCDENAHSTNTPTAQPDTTVTRTNIDKDGNGVYDGVQVIKSYKDGGWNVREFLTTRHSEGDSNDVKSRALTVSRYDDNGSSVKDTYTGDGDSYTHRTRTEVEPYHSIGVTNVTRSEDCENDGTWDYWIDGTYSENERTEEKHGTPCY